MGYYGIIAEGKIEVRSLPQGKVLETLESGRSVGDIYFFGLAHPVEMVAAEDTKCICMRFSEFLEFLDVLFSPQGPDG